MSKVAHGTRRVRVVIAAASVALTALALGGCAGTTGTSASGGEVTLEFAQWWEPELPSGALRGLMDTFEQQNPGITVKLLSGPYASTKEQLFAGAAAGTMSDVVGLDGAWVNDFAKQGAIANLTDLMTQQNYDDSELASQVEVDGATYMIPVVNFVYPMFTNDDLLARAGVTTPPSNRTEFANAAKAVSARGNGVSGTALPLSMEAPSGIQNQVMSLVWASGGSMLKNGKPDLQNADVTSVVTYLDDLYKAGAVAPGALTMKEQDMVEEFTNGRVGMMIDSLAHVNTIRKANPNLSFSISALPAADGYTGARGIPYASWGVGVSANSAHPAEAWKLVQYLMSESVNAQLASAAKAFPGNKTSVPDFVGDDALFKKVFEIYKAGFPANEFTGLPAAEDLMRQFDEQFQRVLTGEISVGTALANAQKSWSASF